MHLFANDEYDIFGVNSNEKFNEVIARIRKEDCHDLDMILLTGDLSQDETEASYQKIVDALAVLNKPVYWIPGNHDDITSMEAAFRKSKQFIRHNHLMMEYWDFIFLNTKLDGSGEGYLSQTELQILKNKLASANNNKRIAIIMHHHPAEVGTPLIDKYILRNRADFWDIVARSQVNLIICGHVHGDYSFKYQDIMIESSPATCLQWQKGTETLQTELSIGYKIYYFDRDGYQAITKIWD